MFNSLLILSGGSSTRFWPLTDKNLTPYLGLTLLEYQLSTFQKIAQQIIIVTNKSNKSVIEQIVNGTDIQVKLVEQVGNGQGEAILSAKKYLHGKTLIINANDIFNQNIVSILSRKLELSDCDGVITTRIVSDYFPGGYVICQDDNVTEIIEKPEKNHVPSERIKLVVDGYRDISEFIQILESTQPIKDDQYEQSISKYIKLGKKITYEDYSEDWIAIKYPWDVIAAMQFFLSKIKDTKKNSVKIAGSAEIQGRVYFDEGVVVHPFATIVGPCYIGKNTIIGSYSMIRESNIGRDSLIGGYSEVTRSYLGNHVYLHRNYVGDSVLENNILMGADAVIANYRFDEQLISSRVRGEYISTGRSKFGAVIGSNVKIGVNSSIMPGVKIAPSSVVSPQSLIKTDIS